MLSIKKVLMERDDMTPEQADAQISKARLILSEYLEDGDLDAAQDICLEMFGLEPDYILDLV